MNEEAALSPPLHCMLTFLYLPTYISLFLSLFLHPTPSAMPEPGAAHQPFMLWCQMTAARAEHHGGFAGGLQCLASDLYT